MCPQPGRDALMNAFPVLPQRTVGARPWPLGDSRSARSERAVHSPFPPGSAFVAIPLASVALWSRAEERQHAH